MVFLRFRPSRRPPTERYPYGRERAEDLAGIGIAIVIWGVRRRWSRDLPEAGSLTWISRAGPE